jgi:hypothetical protein
VEQGCVERQAFQHRRAPVEIEVEQMVRQPDRALADGADRVGVARDTGAQDEAANGRNG